MRLVVSNVDLILTGSQATANDLQDFLNISPKKIRVTPYAARDQFRPVSEEAKRSVREKYGLPTTFFLCLGTFEPRKNLVRCVEAFSLWADKLRSDLVLAGRWGWKAASLREAINRSTVRERIHLPGFVEDADLPALLNAATALVYPSLWEGFGLPVVEAMACGTPVITSNRSSLPEVAGEAAILVDPEDTESLGDALMRVDGDPNFQQELTEKGIQRASCFSWEKTAALTAAAYRELV